MLLFDNISFEDIFLKAHFFDGYENNYPQLFPNGDGSQTGHALVERLDQYSTFRKLAHDVNIACVRLSAI